MGILLWSLAGLLRLQGAGQLTQPEGQALMMRAWTEQADSAVMFLAECCSARAGAVSHGDTLYKRYRDWAEMVQGLPTKQIASRRKFTQSLESEGYPVVFIGGEASRARGYQGIELARLANNALDAG
jgi:phage/plasmid-associated DNA primase